MGEEHYPAVLRLCLHLLGNRDDAEDAAQETFRRALKQDLAALDDPLRWLRTVARHVCIDELRRRRAGVPVEPALESMADVAEDPEGLVVGRAFVRHLLGRLTPAERRVVEARLVEDRSGPELAAALGVSPSTARVLLSRGLAKLRHYLADSQSGLGGTVVGALRAAKELRRVIAMRIRLLMDSGSDGPGLAQGVAALLSAALATLCLCLPGSVAGGHAAAGATPAAPVALAATRSAAPPAAAAGAAPRAAARPAAPRPSARSAPPTGSPPPQNQLSLIPQGPLIQSAPTPQQGIWVGRVYILLEPGPWFWQACSSIPSDSVQVRTGPANPRCPALPSG